MSLQKKTLFMKTNFTSESKQHKIWKTVRRPFRYPSCFTCTWEVYDFGIAGCLKCGAQHVCSNSSVSNTCPLVLCEDGSRVCPITGCVVHELRTSDKDFHETADFHYASTGPIFQLESEIHSIILKFLLSSKAERYRLDENNRQLKKLSMTIRKILKRVKTNVHVPNFCQIISECIYTEKQFRLIYPPSDTLVEECTKQICLCLAELHKFGLHVNSGNRLNSLVIGLLYLLKTGLIYKNQMLLAKVEEVKFCLPYENKLWEYFCISSKVLCETENEIKLLFRERLQDTIET